MRDDDSTIASGGAAPVVPVHLSRVGRYVVEGVLGSGGTATVYLARDPALDRTIALKVIRAGGGPRASSRLLREGQAIARVSHPNVIHVYEVGREADELVYVAMERIDGATLDRWLQQPRPQRAILDVFAAAGRGLAAAHAAGLVHRDFKPENVIVGHDGRVRVLDFGLARPAGEQDGDDAVDAGHGLLAVDLTATGAITGTPAYMSPEQWLGQPTDARSDQFSFCVSLYRALTGQHPFDISSRETLRDGVVAGRVAAMPRAVPARLRRVLRRGLATTAGERHGSITEVVAALEARRPWRAIGLAASVLTVAAIVGYLALRRGGGDRAPPPPPPPRSAVTIYSAPQRITVRGDVGRAAVSPDGRQLAYLTQDGLVVQPLEPAAEQRVLLRGRLAYHALAWSPDAARIALVAAGEQDAAASPGLVVVEVATGAVRRVTTNLGTVALLDGDELVAAHFADKELAFYSIAAPERPTRTCALPAPFSGVRAVRYQPQLDAIFVQIDQGDRMSSILRVDRACSRIDVVAGPLAAMSFVVQPSDARILARLMYQHDLFEVGPDGQPTDAQHVIQSSNYEPLAIRGDGSIVHLDHATRWQLMALGAGGARTELVGGAAESRFAIAPDGELVAHVDGVYGDGLLRIGPLADLGSISGSIARDVVRVAWAPDGARLAVLLQTADGYGVAVWDRATATLAPSHPVTIRYDAEMAWLDHRLVLCTPPDWRSLRWIDPVTGKTGELTPPGELELMSVSRAHREPRLALVSETTGEILVWTWLATDQPPSLLATIAVTSPRSARKLRVTWAPDDDALILYDSNSGHMWSIAAVGGAVTALPGVPPPRGGGFTNLYEVFPLADRMLIEQVTASGDVYVSGRVAP